MCVRLCAACDCNPAGTDDTFEGCANRRNESKRLECPCKEYVEGFRCDQCKSHYHSLKAELEKGCAPCNCVRNGSLNELDLCNSRSGQCHCKPFAQTDSCGECSNGFYALERDNLFGCRPCGCHMGSSIQSDAQECDKQTGACNCLDGIVGLKCDQVAAGFFVADLHQLKFEMEDSFSEVDAKPIRYDFNNETFAGFSWRGYVHLNKNLGTVSQTVPITKPGTYRMLLRYMNLNGDSEPAPSVVSIGVRKDGAADNGDVQKADVKLAPTGKVPRFATVTASDASGSISQEFLLELEQAGDYAITFKSEALENVYVDFFVLLPSNYFESSGSALKQPVYDACRDDQDNMCIHYEYPPLAASPRALTVRLDDLLRTNMPENVVDLDTIKHFEHKMQQPLEAVRLQADKPIGVKMQLDADASDNSSMHLFIEHMNVDAVGREVLVTLNNGDSERVGRVFLYPCNIT